MILVSCMSHHPALMKLELSSNNISDIGAECLLNFLYDQFRSLSLGNMEDGSEDDKTESNEAFFSYENLQQISNTWELSLKTTVINLFASNEYIHIRSVLLVLDQISDIWPRRIKVGDELLTAVSSLHERETREDLKLSIGVLIINRIKVKM